MKRFLLALCLIFSVFTLNTQAQVPKKTPDKPSIEAKDSTVTLTMTSHIDTLEVKMVIENNDGFLEVKKGYALRFFWLNKATQEPMSQNPSKVAYFTDKWVALDPEKIIEPLTRQTKRRP